MTAEADRQFMALMAVVQHHGRPHTPTDQAWIETLFGHVKGEWPHLEALTDPAVLEAELARVRKEFRYAGDPPAVRKPRPRWLRWPSSPASSVPGAAPPPS